MEAPAEHLRNALQLLQHVRMTTLRLANAAVEEDGHHLAELLADAIEGHQAVSRRLRLALAELEEPPRFPRCSNCEALLVLIQSAYPKNEGLLRCPWCGQIENGAGRVVTPGLPATDPRELAPHEVENTGPDVDPAVMLEQMRERYLQLTEPAADGEGSEP